MVGQPEVEDLARALELWAALAGTENGSEPGALTPAATMLQAAALLRDQAATIATLRRTENDCEHIAT